MGTNKNSEYVLGVMVSSRTVYGVLIDVGASEPVVVKQMLRHRISRAVTQQPGMVMAGADAQDTSGNDFTLHFGEGGQSSHDLFLQSEFSNLDRKGGADSVAQPSSFEYELSEMLDECRQSGYMKPTVAFCSSTSDVTHAEIRVPEKSKRRSEQKSSSNGKTPARKASNEQLVDLFVAQHQGEVDKERIAFLQMTPSDDGELRYLALAAKNSEPVATTLNVLRRQKDEPMPTVRLLDTETAIYMGLTRLLYRKSVAMGKPVGGHTLVVRAGSEDTLVMFVQGEQLHHFEIMRSLTAYDSPETICSRVLLQQDEYGIDDVQDILVLTDGRESELIESLCMFFPEAQVSSLSDALPGMAEVSANQRTPQTVVATAVATRLLRNNAVRSAFDEVNLLPKRYLRKKIELPFTVPTLLLGVLIFATAFFFGARFVIIESKINDIQEQLSHYPPDLGKADPKVLQARIDSLHATHKAYMHALAVMDTLLVGSDVWSRTLDVVSREAGRVPGLWIENWHPAAGEIEVKGSSVARDKVIQLAERLQADVDALTFSEIREMPLYSFSMRVPLKEELPVAAVYLRDKASEQIALKRKAMTAGASEAATQK